MGWVGGVHSHFHVKPNRCVVLCWGWGFDNLKLTKYSRWKLSGCVLWDLGRLELTVSRGQFGRLCRQVYMKVSKQASM